MKTKTTTILTLLIGALGSLQMIGHTTGSRTIRGLGLATGIAPYPKVFCEAEGYEPFAANFTISGTSDNGEPVEIPLTAERYSQLAGPYQRRNVYGATLAYAPRLPENLRTHLFKEVLSENSPLSKELNIPPLTNPQITITPRDGETTTSYQYPLNK